MIEYGVYSIRTLESGVRTELMKGSETSKAVVGFNYEDKMVGTMGMDMIKEEKIWKIDNLDLPKFDKFTLPQAKEE